MSTTTTLNFGTATHELKTWPEHYQALASLTKTAELRRNDRAYQVGDTLHLREFDPDTNSYTGRDHYQLITHLLAGPGFGLEAGYVMLSLLYLPL